MVLGGQMQEWLLHTIMLLLCGGGGGKTAHHYDIETHLDSLHVDQLTADVSK